MTQSVRGYLRPSGDEPQFRPCGTRALLDVTGPTPTRIKLKERFRWNTPSFNVGMFAQLQGAIVNDTARLADSVTGVLTAVPRTRFFVADVESLRPWRQADCNGMRVP